jgi:glucose-6-phosphate 1-dehydrogenase
MLPFIIVIFGGTGDLARNKLLPALYSIFCKGGMGDKFYIVSFARRKLSDEDYRKMLGEEWGMAPASAKGYGEAKWEDFVRHVYYSQGYFDEITGYEELSRRLNAFDEEAGVCATRLFYLATLPDNYLPILDRLKESKLSETSGAGSEKLTRLAIEKPFGKDLENAIEIDKVLGEIFEEKQIYRVDHYLAKETVQNMLAFRFANGIFEPVWNKNYLDHVQITFAEKKGIGGRGNFFDGIGILRDVAQNHLLQLLATIAMEQPKGFSREAIRDARAAAIKAIRRIEPIDVASQVVRAQYEGYRRETGVAKDSATETFVAMKLFVDTERFEGVPFYIRAGKRMATSVVEIKLIFMQTCHVLFKEYNCPEIGNVLTIRIQPDEGIGMRVVVKHPDSKLALDTVDMKFSYREEFGGHGSEAYEKLLLDIFSGDQMLFNRSDELASSWRLISQIMEGWRRQDVSSLAFYAPGEKCPKEADELIEKDGKKWIES